MKTPRCPTCGVELSPQSSKGVEVDSCPACGGIWFDPGEFDVLVASRFSNVLVEDLFDMMMSSVPAPLACPHDACDMSRIYFNDIELERCPTCKGIWLDAEDRQVLRRSAEQAQAPLQEAKEELPRWDSGELELVEVPRIDVSALVTCAGCGSEVQQRECQSIMGAYWCEACVVSGDVPMGTGTTVQKRVAEAALAYSKANVELEGKRERNRLAQKAMTTRRAHFGRVQLSPDAYTLTDAVKSVASRVRKLVTREDE